MRTRKASLDILPLVCLGRLFDVAPDGRFQMLKSESSAEPAHIVLVQNWVADLARQLR